MNPELKSYLDEWQAEHQRDCKVIMASLDAINQSMLRASDYFRRNSELLASVTASSGATKLATVSAREAQRPALVDKLHDAFLPPATELGAAEHDNSTPIVGPVQASSDTSELVTVSAGLAEPPAPAPSIVASPLVALAAPIDTIAVVPASCSTKCAAQAVTASTTTTLLPWVSASSSSLATSANNGVVSTELASDNYPDEHGVSPASSSLSSSPTRFTAWKNVSPTAPTPTDVSDTQLLWPFPVQVLSPLAPVKHSTECMDDDTHALMLPSVRGAAENFSIPILDTGQVVLCTSSLPCVENIEVEALSMGDIIPDDTGANQRPPWPPPDLKVLCSNGIHSSQLTNPILELEAHSSSYAPSFLKIYSVNEENQKTPCLCEVIPGAITCGPDYFRWEIACVLVVSPSARTNIGNASDLADAPTASAPDAYTKAWARPKDPSDLESYLKAHYCHDCEGLPVCTHNIFVCWESDIVPPPYPYMSRCDNSKSRPIPWPSFADLSRGVHITEPRPPLQGTWGEFFSVVELHCFSYGLSGISPLPMCLQWSRPIESVCKLSGKIIQAGLGPPEEYLFVWLQPKPPWSYILIKIDAEVEERGVHLRVAEITSVQLILFKLLLPVGICLYELPLPGYSLYSSSFGSASEELFRESKKLEFNNWVSYMLEQYNYISTCGINTELQSLCECTNRPLMQAVGIPDSNKQLQLCMAARGLFILQNQGHRWMSHEFAPLCYCYTTLLAAQGADTDGIVTRKQYGPCSVDVENHRHHVEPSGSHGTSVRGTRTLRREECHLRNQILRASFRRQQALHRFQPSSCQRQLLPGNILRLGPCQP